MSEINLEEGEVICSLCDGTGVTCITNEYWDEGEYRRVSCYQCDGKGKTDWVTNIMGVPEPDYTGSSTSSSQSGFSCSVSSSTQSVLHYKRPKKEDLKIFVNMLKK